ncbi:MAG: prolyl oligopeptidase family serine peptidase [Bacteroidales bacterium]|nr:prolyl oligopeptidase family serine peptidase [Bacteroidales bacterium]
MRTNFIKSKIITLIIFLFITVIAISQEQNQTTDPKQELQALQTKINDLQHEFDILKKGMDDILWYEKVGDYAFIDKVYITGPPRTNVKNPTAMGATNPLKFYAYIFIPKGIDLSKKYPLIVLPHGGVHADFTTYHTHIIRELLYQNYIVIAPEYRGSTGYGKSFFQNIDYGGRENEDIKASRDYMVQNYEFIDKDRIGIVGWSHGGMMALMNIFNYPDDYKVCFAGVPVSDLVARMGYYTDDYRGEFSADYHLGKTANENIEEYRKRSPAWNAEKLKTPLLIHTNTNDDDVNVLEVEHLIQALKAEGKKFEYEIFKDVEGGHSFDRIDTKIAKEIRVKIYAFLAKYLEPPVQIKTVDDINKAAYRPK